MWSQPMVCYFEENIMTAVLENAERCALEECDIYNLLGLQIYEPKYEFKIKKACRV